MRNQKKEKYLRKNEFRDYTNSKHLSKNKKAHKAYISVKYKNAYKFNVITHSHSFFGQPTKELKDNPQIKSMDKRKSRVSVPHWENKSRFSKSKAFKDNWRMSKKNKVVINKWNKKWQ